MMLKKFLVALTLFVLCLAHPLFAQSDKATITGTVRDATSAMVSGVEVTITNVGTNQVETVKTDRAGLYRVGNLSIGNYDVRFT